MYNDSIDWMKLGNKITRMRVSRKMTQFELAECTCLSDVYIGYLEQGKRRASLDTYVKIVNALGYTLDDLMSEYLTNRDTVAIDLKSLLEDCRDEERLLVLQLIKDMIAVIHVQPT